MQLAGIFIYPVKGCRGISLPSASMDSLGIVGDRRFLIVDPNGKETDYTYDSTHGGLLTVTGPAVSGGQPVTRYEYALLNVDIYFPIFQTLIPIETQLPSINNLQLGVFADMANAKETWNTREINRSIKTAYGFCARTTLAGYPLRFDLGLPRDGQPAIWYLSINKGLN